MAGCRIRACERLYSSSWLDSRCRQPGRAPEHIVFARVFPQPGQIGLFIAAADGSDEHPLVSPARHGLRRDVVAGRRVDRLHVRAQRFGRPVSRQAGRQRPRTADRRARRTTTRRRSRPTARQLVFVTTRANGTADLWTLDLQTRRAKALTSGAGGDFRPSWSPDGQWIAFSSDRASNLPFSHGRWEHLQLVDLYVVHPDGSGLKRMTHARRLLRQPEVDAPTAAASSPTAWARSRRSTTGGRVPEHPEDTRIVVGRHRDRRDDRSAGRSGREVQPVAAARADCVGYIRREGDGARHSLHDGTRGPAGEIRTAAWSPDGAHVVFHKRVTFTRKPWVKTWSRTRATS